MKILVYSLVLLSVAALFAAGIMTMTMTMQTAEANKGIKAYCDSEEERKDCYLGKNKEATGEGVSNAKEFCEEAEDVDKC